MAKHQAVDSTACFHLLAIMVRPLSVFSSMNVGKHVTWNGRWKLLIAFTQSPPSGMDFAPVTSSLTHSHSQLAQATRTYARMALPLWKPSVASKKRFLVHSPLLVFQTSVLVSAPLLVRYSTAFSYTKLAKWVSIQPLFTHQNLAACSHSRRTDHRVPRPYF